MKIRLRWGMVLGVLVLSADLLTACGSNGGAASVSGNDAAAGNDAPAGNDAGDTATDAGADHGTLKQDSGLDSGPSVGQLDGSLDTALPPLPALTNVVAIEREDSVGIDFDPVDDAVDYRVYPLPSDGDVTVQSNGSIVVKNTVYRCAGLRQTFDLPNNTSNDINGADGGQVYVNGIYSWKASIPANPTLGYVYPSAAPGLVPVYAVGVHPTAPEVGWNEARPKIYTTDATLRQTLLAQAGRDDGIVFYVPASASASTETLYHSENVQNQGSTTYTESYFTSADLSSHMGDTTPPSPAFPILTASGSNTQPLMAVLYQASEQHTELAVGKERFRRASNQGPGPLWHLEWAGITVPTTLVVEALASGCPYQGFLSPQHLDNPAAGVGGAIHQPFLTLADMQAASPTGEVFINGQYDLPGASWWSITDGWTDAGAPALATPDASPIPIARSFVKVAPQPHDPSAWDWYEGFTVGKDFPALAATPDPSQCGCDTSAAALPCNSGAGGCGYWTSPVLDVGVYLMDNPNDITVFTYGQFLGQFWEAFDDWAQDVTSHVRYTAAQETTISTDASQFLHVTWSVNTVGTDRRYPQLIVADQGMPVQDGFSNPDSNHLLIQTIEGPSMRLEVQAFHGLVNGIPWAVNNQAPNHALVDYDNWNNPGADQGSNGSLVPAPSPFELSGMDRMIQYDAYVSSQRVYVFMNGTPAGCTQYPGGGFALSGMVTVTFGDVLYHEGAPDELVCYQSTPFTFMHEHQCIETKRHWDDLGFKAGVGAPVWNETNFPCSAY
jgi:hypothetical protein